MTKFEEDFNYLIRLSGNVSIGQADFELFEKNRIAFFEKYEIGQSQSLPIVPEDVDKAIKYLKTQNNFATFADFDDILTEKGLKWLNDFQFKDRRFGFGGLNNKLFILSHLAITGYTVEKQQLFYDKYSSVTAKNYIEHAIGTIKHDGHLGTIQTDWILSYLEKALEAIGTTGCPAGLIGTNGVTDENFIEVFELQEQLNTAKKALTEAIGDIEQLNGSDDTIKYYKQALAAIGEDKEIK